MTDRIVVERPKRPMVSRAWTGLVAAHAETDYPKADDTVRVDGHDVLDQFRQDVAGLNKPVRAVFTLDGNRFETDRLDWTIADSEYLPPLPCSDPHCCGWAPDEWEIRLGVGGTDIVPLLEAMHGETAVFGYVLTGYAEPIVTATLAHYWRKHLPGDQVTLPLSQMQRLTTSRLVRDHAEQVKALAAKEYRR